MGRPIGVKDRQPRMYLGMMASKDSESYILPDSGCEKATSYIQEHYPLEIQSICLECPFGECVYDHETRGGWQKGRSRK